MLSPLRLASSARFARAGAVALLALTAALVPAAPASAEVRGNVGVTPLSGADSTLLRGSVTTDCPEDTADSYWTIDGPDLPPDTAFLAPVAQGDGGGDGVQAFAGASIANIKTTSNGSFSASGTYRIRFSCVRSPDGVVTDTYEAILRYTAGGAGAFTIEAAVPGQPVPNPFIGQDLDGEPLPSGPLAFPGAPVPPPAAVQPGEAPAPDPAPDGEASASAESGAGATPDASPAAGQEADEAVGRLGDPTGRASDGAGGISPLWLGLLALPLLAAAVLWRRRVADRAETPADELASVS